jgi:hypothetical protein
MKNKLTYKLNLHTCKALYLLGKKNLLFTNQDASMPVTIKEVFPGTFHRLCKWHILSKFSAQLNELYSTYSKREFKGKFYSVINHPLTVHESKNAWKMLIIDEFNLGENATLGTLYAIRQEWVSTFFKKDYCGTTISAQRGESVNHIVKKCHVDANTPLYEFAKQMMKLLHRRKMTERVATYVGMVYISSLPVTHFIYSCNAVCMIVFLFL